MNALAARLIAGCVFVLSFGAGWQYMRAMRAELETAQQAAQEALAGNQQRDAVIATMASDAELKSQALATLASSQQQIRASLDRREQNFRKLIDENANVKSWADTAVPLPVISVRQHGPSTGAAAYQAQHATADGVQSARTQP